MIERLAVAVCTMHSFKGERTLMSLHIMWQVCYTCNERRCLPVNNVYMYIHFFFSPSPSPIPFAFFLTLRHTFGHVCDDDDDVDEEEEEERVLEPRATFFGSHTHTLYLTIPLGTDICVHEQRRAASIDPRGSVLRWDCETPAFRSTGWESRPDFLLLFIYTRRHYYRDRILTHGYNNAEKFFTWIKN